MKIGTIGIFCRFLFFSDVVPQFAAPMRVQSVGLFVT
jgi:hypothetical protein